MAPRHLTGCRGCETYKSTHTLLMWIAKYTRPGLGTPARIVSQMGGQQFADETLQAKTAARGWALIFGRPIH